MQRQWQKYIEAHQFKSENNITEDVNTKWLSKFPDSNFGDMRMRMFNELKERMAQLINKVQESMSQPWNGNVFSLTISQLP